MESSLTKYLNPVQIQSAIFIVYTEKNAEYKLNSFINRNLVQEVKLFVLLSITC